MANSCLQLGGFLVSCLGWIGVVIATSTNDWVNMCKYGLNTCKKMDELEAKGPWAECVISTGLYHCVSLTQILELPGGPFVINLVNLFFSHSLVFVVHSERSSDPQCPNSSMCLCSLHPDHSCPDDHWVNPGFPGGGTAPDVHALHQSGQRSPALQKQARRPGRSARSHRR